LQSFRNFGAVTVAVLFLVFGCQSGSDDSPTVIISVLGTNDVHGSLLPVDGNRGLALFGGYVANLRAVREDDGGAVLLIDAGDMWQGSIESNLSEGASVVAAFNAIGYNAAAIGNHEFDFGPAGPKATPESESDDAQGALKTRAAEADFRLLAANLIDKTTGRPVKWRNVRPSLMLDRNGFKIGIIGVMTRHALQTTIASNTRGLSVAPLSLAIVREAQALRKAGADLIIVAAHAGSYCEQFNDPRDLSSCDLAGEIMQVALDLPAGLVDQIIGGHVHQGIAHEVNGIAITSSFSNTRAFGRVDYVFNRANRGIIYRQIFEPQPICGFLDNTTGRCVAASEAIGATQVARYADRAVAPNAEVVEIAQLALQHASEIKSEKLGVLLETPITRAGQPSSAIGHLFTDIVLDATGGDVVIHNVVGGIRADLPQGDLTYGSVYEMYPFDNVVVRLNLTGAEMRQIVKREVFKTRRRAGFSGMRAFVSCDNNELDVSMTRQDGSTIDDDDVLEVLTTDFLATGGDNILTPIIPTEGFPIDTSQPLVREVIADWLRKRGGKLSVDTFSDAGDPKWNIAASVTAACSP